MPNLRGASPVSREVWGRSYAARAVRRGRSQWWDHDRGGVSGTCREDDDLRVL